MRKISTRAAYGEALAEIGSDPNILCLGGQMLGRWQALEIVRVWLDTPYDGGHHQGSLDLLRQMEEAMMNGSVWCPEEVPYPPFVWDPDQPLGHGSEKRASRRSARLDALVLRQSAQYSILMPAFFAKASHSSDSCWSVMMVPMSLRPSKRMLAFPLNFVWSTMR